MKIVVLPLCILSATETILCILPAANNLYWPAVAVAMELWPWFILINILGLLFIGLKSKPLALVFALGLIVSAWPLFSVSSVIGHMDEQCRKQKITIANAPHIGQLLVRSFSNFHQPVIAPETLPGGILLHRAFGASALRKAPIIINIPGGGWHYGSVN